MDHKAKVSQGKVDLTFKGNINILFPSDIPEGINPSEQESYLEKQI